MYNIFLDYVALCCIVLFMRQFKSNNNIVFDCKYHVIWCTKYRRNLITDAVKVRLKQVITGVAEERKAEIIEMEAGINHFHLLVSIDPQYGIHRLIKQMKGRSSRILRKEFPHTKSRVPTLWTNSYCCITVGGASMSTLKQYIKSQKNK